MVVLVVVVAIVLIGVVVCMTHLGTGKSHIPTSTHVNVLSPFKIVPFKHSNSASVPTGIVDNLP